MVKIAHSERGQIRTEVARIIGLHKLRALVEPTKVADAALPLIKPHLKSIAATLYLRQITRSILSQTPTTKRVKHSGSGLLHTRYPTIERGGYLPIEDLSESDIRWNVARLRKEGMARMSHADELERYGIDNGTISLLKR